MDEARLQETLKTVVTTNAPIVKYPTRCCSMPKHTAAALLTCILNRMKKTYRIRSVSAVFSMKSPRHRSIWPTAFSPPQGDVTAGYRRRRLPQEWPYQITPGKKPLSRSACRSAPPPCGAKKKWYCVFSTPRRQPEYRDARFDDKQKRLYLDRWPARRAILGHRPHWFGVKNRIALYRPEYSQYQ